MSIFPATDLVMDVARAADPARRDAAVRRLNDVAPATQDPGAFTRLVDAPPSTARSVAPPPSPFTHVQAKLSPDQEARQKFEAFVLQSWMEILLPKEQSGAFGTGPGAGVWRSFMAEQLGAQLTKVDALGLHRTMTGAAPQVSTARRA